MPTRVGFFSRLGAAALDLLLFLPVLVLLVVLFALLAADGSLGDAAAAERAFAASLLAGWLLYSATELVWAATPGKMILGQRIAAADHRPAGFWRLFLRWSTKQLPVIAGLLFVLTDFVLLQLLGGFMNVVLTAGFLAAANDDKRSWLDEWAGTAVYRRRTLTAGRIAPPPLPAMPAGS